VNWIVRFVRFHGMRSRQDLFLAEAKVEAFLTDLAVQGNDYITSFAPRRMIT